VGRRVTFDEQKLRRLLREMTFRSKFCRVLREELKARGFWKNRPRGKPAKPWTQRGQS
jgi:hypothetical protein